MKIHKRILKLRPEWTEKVKVVMTSGNKDPEEWADIIGGKAYKKELAKKFKDENDTMKIAIVVDMWLTGFDVPSLATMYVYKPMKDHNLMQAIARVNRVFPEKAGGLIVDYVGIAAALKDAMKRYTKRDQSNYGNNDIKDRAYSEFKERLEICRDLLHGYDFSNFQHGSPAERARLIKGAVNHMIAPDKAIDCKDFIKNASLLRQAVTLCRSLLIGEERFEVGFMESVRTLIVRLQRPGKVTKREINQRIAALIEQSVTSDGVVNLFDEQSEFSLFDEKFMEEVRKMKEKNLAVKLLEDLIRGRVRTLTRSNLVTGELFSNRFSETLNRYINGLLSNEEVIQELALLPPESATLQCQSGTWRHSSATWRRRQVARRDQAHSQKHDAKKDFEREKEEKRRFDDELSYFFVNLPKRRKRTKRRRHPAYADTQKGGCKTHIARMSVSHGTLCRHSRHLRTGRRRARLHNEHDNDGRAARQHDRKRHTYQLT